MTAYRPRLSPSPSPPPALPAPKVSLSLSPNHGHRRSSNRRRKIRPSQGDAVLIHYLDGGKRPELAAEAMMHPLPQYRDEYDDHSKSDTEDLSTDDESGDEDDILSHNNMSPDPIVVPTHVEPVKPKTNLQVLATDALAAVTAGQPSDADSERRHEDDPRITLKTKPPDVTIPNGNGLREGIESKDGIRDLSVTPMSPYPAPGSHDTFSPRQLPLGQVLMHPRDVTSPNGLSRDARAPLPPIQVASPRSETSSHEALPSIRDHLHDQLSPPRQELPMRHGNPFPTSPPSGMPRMGSISGSHASPPISPNDALRQSVSSPTRSITVTSPYYYSSAASSSSHQRSGADYSSNGDTPNTDHSSSAATQGSISNRMSIDNVTNPQVGGYSCTFHGCTAPPFHTQYLLNSHANVHSSNRPHYCPVKGCPRSEGGKGFKRKNEMIRHGLVHESPGYVCPFCPDREHKYPRPDNLQRHVRVHHIDKDKDDPRLRDVLSQRPDGPSRGRRRRGGV
jgi:hypothetical protein